MNAAADVFSPSLPCERHDMTTAKEASCLSLFPSHGASVPTGLLLQGSEARQTLSAELRKLRWGPELIREHARARAAKTKAVWIL